MYHPACLVVFLLDFSILCYARHTVLRSHSSEKFNLASNSKSDVCMTRTCIITAADVLTSLDETVDPCDDFYSFACGGWMKKQQFTDGQPKIDLFVTSENDLNLKLREFIESKYESSDPPYVKILKEFYNSCVDLDTIEKQRSDPLKRVLCRLGGWPVVEGSQWNEATFGWMDTLVALRKLGYDHEILFSLHDFYHGSEDDVTNYLLLDAPYFDKMVKANLTLGLDDPKIAAYYEMMVKAAELLGAEKTAAAKELLEALHFEMDLVKVALAKGRDSSEYTIEELEKKLPQVPWLKLIKDLLMKTEVFENQTIINSNNNYFLKLVELITSTDKRVIANYMLSTVVLDSKDYLSQEWKDIEEGDDKELLKKKKSSEIPRWKQCLSFLKDRMHMGLASYYVRQYFNEESKDGATMLIKYIKKEFLRMLKNNDWMDGPTKKKAKEKANALKAYIGYPEELLNDTFIMKIYENLSLTTENYLENILIFHKWETDRHYSMFTKNFPERDGMRRRIMFGVLYVAVFHSQLRNSIAVPAGILQNEFYDKDKPQYINFARIGSVIGHEITHGFDDDGQNFDENGNYGVWWNEESDERFRKKVKCIIDQYNNYTSDIGLKLNGEKTQNENIADIGGLKGAYLAYQSWIKNHGTEPLLPGVNYNQNQIFWLSAARVWCTKYQSEALKTTIVDGEQSPGKFRIVGPMSNLAEFSKDFNCSPDAAMNRKNKCEIW